ncbi:AMP-binding protein, partial [Chitinophaga varians]|uniref:AMP-binding protein n=1 Tax=Chitinophaga varians TaxID=2202339 RepID=UPI00165F7186
LQTEDITVFETVPSLLSAFLEGLPEEAPLPSLRWLIPTGEALPVPLAVRWYSRYPGIPLLNAYGPTEASDDITHYVVPADIRIDQPYIPIGRPGLNMRTYILDRYQHPCPPGVRGEICVSGICVGLGYWKDEERSSRAFVANPLSGGDAAYGRLYRTGDQGYYQPDGNLVCTGRLDTQIKLRGNRIELGEIEHVLGSYA